MSPEEKQEVSARMKKYWTSRLKPGQQLLQRPRTLRHLLHSRPSLTVRRRPPENRNS
jgi:hypothetical protein